MCILLFVFFRRSSKIWTCIFCGIYFFLSNTLKFIHFKVRPRLYSTEDSEVHRHTFRISLILFNFVYRLNRVWEVKQLGKVALKNYLPLEWVTQNQMDHNDVVSFYSSALLFNSAKLEMRQKISGCTIRVTWFFRWVFGKDVR